MWWIVGIILIIIGIIAASIVIHNISFDEKEENTMKLKPIKYKDDYYERTNGKWAARTGHFNIEDKEILVNKVSGTFKIIIDPDIIELKDGTRLHFVAKEALKKNGNIIVAPIHQICNDNSDWVNESYLDEIEVSMLPD